jgi:hypothetical protein
VSMLTNPFCAGVNWYQTEPTAGIQAQLEFVGSPASTVAPVVSTSLEKGSAAMTAGVAQASFAGAPGDAWARVPHNERSARTVVAIDKNRIVDTSIAYADSRRDDVRDQAAAGSVGRARCHREERVSVDHLASRDS